FPHEGIDVVCYVKTNPAFENERPAGLLIRSYLEQDEDDVVRLWDTVFPNPPFWNVPVQDIRRKLAVQRDLFVVGVKDGQVVATTMAGYDGHRGWLHRVAVHPD